MKMWRFILEFLSYSSFICVAYVISYSNHNSDEYRQVNHLRQLLLNPQSLTLSYSKIIKINDYWKWLEESFIENIFPGEWYNGQSVNNSQGYLNDKVNRLFGWATMRQLRIKSDTCRVKASIQSLIPECYGEYSTSNEETRSFFPQWSLNNITQNYSSSIKQAFQYQTGEQLGTYFYIGDYATYGSGGYVYQFRGSLSQLHADLAQLQQLEWIDRQTRAVMIDMSLYNPNIPVFTSVILIIELLPSSGIFPNARFDPFDFNAFKSLFQIICAFIYLTFILYFMIVEFYSFLRLKKSYFYQIWSYFELGIISCSWAIVGIHIWRTNEVARITHLFYQNKGDVYVNFQLMVYVNNIFSFLIGFCCFFGTIRLLRLCRYNRRLEVLSNTLKRARGELLSFSFMFLLIFMAFLALFYLQFVSLIWECSNLLHTTQMLFEMFLLKFDVTEIQSAAPVLGPLYFALFILFVVFVCMNMFISIIIDNFRAVREDIEKIVDENEDLFIHLLKKLKQCCGKEERTNVVGINNKIYVINVAEMSAPIQRLSNRLDQLIIYVNRHYGDEKVQIARNETSVSTLSRSMK